MGESISTPAVLFILFVIGTAFGFFLWSKHQKDKKFKLVEDNLKLLPPPIQERFTALQKEDQEWFEEVGNALDGVELTDAYAIALDAAWAAMDDAEELLKREDFARSPALHELFATHLNKASAEFVRTSDEYAKYKAAQEES